MLSHLNGVSNGSHANASEAMNDCSLMEVALDNFDVVYNATPEQSQCPAMPPFPCHKDYTEVEYAVHGTASRCAPCTETWATACIDAMCDQAAVCEDGRQQRQIGDRCCTCPEGEEATSITTPGLSSPCSGRYFRLVQQSLTDGALQGNPGWVWIIIELHFFNSAGEEIVGKPFGCEHLKPNPPCANAYDNDTNTLVMLKENEVGIPGLGIEFPSTQQVTAFSYMYGYPGDGVSSFDVQSRTSDETPWVTVASGLVGNDHDWKIKHFNLPCDSVSTP